MTTIQISNSIPTQIDSLAKINAWSGLALAYLYPALTAIEGVGYTERVAQAGVFYVPADNKNRLLIRTSFEISPDYLSGGQKLWRYVQDFGNTELPQLFRTN